MEKLTGKDYFNRPYVELQSHPDFSNHAFRVINAISNMTTKEIEQINLIGGVK